MWRLLYVLIAVFSVGTVYSTTWTSLEKEDPISADKVFSEYPMSHGEYLDDPEAKYHLIFLPYTMPNWITFNEKSGYGAFNDHFSNISWFQRWKIKRWLRKNYNSAQPPITYMEKLAWLENLYAQRDMDDNFWSMFYRLMAYTHASDKAQSLAYVRKALHIFQKQLKNNPDENKKGELFFLLGEYNRRLGENDKAREFFSKVKCAPYIDDDSNHKVGNPYFINLVRNREKLMID